MHCSFRALLTAAVLAAAVVFPAGAASARSLSIHDATGDTWQMDTSSDTESYLPAGSQANVDLVRTIVRHTAKKVNVIGRYTELKRSGPALFFVVAVRTNEGVRRDVGVQTILRPCGQHMFEKRDGRTARCRGISHTVDYARETISVSVPRSCLGNPRWVQVTPGAVGMTPAGDVYVDNGYDSTSNEPTRWSAKVKRG
jgi:hypothetical protein